jgi:hypothetical protein
MGEMEKSVQEIDKIRYDMKMILEKYRFKTYNDIIFIFKF